MLKRMKRKAPVEDLTSEDETSSLDSDEEVRHF